MEDGAGQGHPSRRSASYGFALILLYVLLEYGRPQSVFPVIEAAHIPALVVVLLGLAVLASGYSILSEKSTRLFVALIIFMIMQVPFAANNYWAYETSRTMILTFVAYAGMLAFLTSWHRMLIFTNSWLIVHGLLALYAIRHRGQGIGGFLSDENDFSMALNMAMPYSLVLLAAVRSVGARLLYLCLALLFLVGDVATLSRGGVIGMVAGLAYYWARSQRRLVSGVIVALIVAFAVSVAPKKYWDEIRSIREQGVTEGTGAERVYMWKVGWKMFIDNPVLGVGPGNFPWNFRKYELSSGAQDFQGMSRAGRVAHSLYFTVLSELGVIGVAIFLLMVRECYRTLRGVRHLNSNIHPDASQRLALLQGLGLASEASMVAFLVSSIFISTLYYPNFWLLVGFVAVLGSLTRESETLGRLRDTSGASLA